MSEIHKNAFWAYGVILALAIREPLSSVVPHFIRTGISDWQVQLEIWRVLLFLVLIIRFYMGSGIYFDDVYMRQGSKEAFKRKSYPIDFLTGLFHFLIFFVCSVTLSLHGHIRDLSYFLAVIAAILAYGNVWWFGAWFGKFDARKQIKEWAQYNNLILIGATAAYLVSRGFEKDSVFSEHMAILVILGFSLYDIKQLINRCDVINGTITAIPEAAPSD